MHGAASGRDAIAKLRIQALIGMDGKIGNGLEYVQIVNGLRIVDESVKQKTGIMVFIKEFATK